MDTIIKHINKTAGLVLLAMLGICATVKAQDVNAIIKQADSLSKVKNYAEAIVLLEKNIKLFETGSPDDALAWSRLGNYHYNTKDYEKAKTYYLKYLDSRKPHLESNPADYAYWYSSYLSSLANTYNELSDYLAAIHTCKENIELIEGYKEHFKNYSYDLAGKYGSLSWYYLFTKDYQLAEQTVHKALSIDSTQTWIKTNLAHSLLFQGKVKKAEDIYYSLNQTIYTGEKTFSQTLLDDFGQLEREGIIPKKRVTNIAKMKKHFALTVKGHEIYNHFDSLWSERKYNDGLNYITSKIYNLPDPHKKWVSDKLGDYAYSLIENEKYSEAEQYYRVAKNLCEIYPDGIQNSNYATYLHNLGFVCKSTGNYSEAEKYYLELLPILEQSIGKSNCKYLGTLSNLGIVNSHLDRKKKNIFLDEMTGILNTSDSLALDCFGSWGNVVFYNSDTEITFGNADMIKNLNDDITFLTKINSSIIQKLMEMIPDFKMIINAIESMTNNHELSLKIARESSNRINSLMIVGKYAILKGDYMDAEKNFLEVKNMINKDHSDYPYLLYQLGFVYNQLGDYNRAEDYLTEAKKSVSDKSTSVYISILTQLAVLNESQGNKEKLRMIQKEIGEISTDSLLMITVVHNISTIDQFLSGNMDYFSNNLPADIAAVDSMMILLKSSLGNNPIVAKCYSLIGKNCLIKKDLSISEYCFLESKDILEQTLQTDHPVYITTLNGLVNIYTTKKEYRQAFTLKKIADKIMVQTLNNNFSFMSEEQRNAFWETQKENFDLGYRLTHEYSSVLRNTSKETVIQSYNNTLFTKGLLLRTNNQIRDAIYLSKDAKLISQFEELGTIRKQIMEYRSKENASVDEIKALEIKADNLDKELTIASKSYKNEKNENSISWEDIKRNLGKNDVAIEFVHFTTPLKQENDVAEVLEALSSFMGNKIELPDTDTIIQYAALVLRKGMKSPVWIPLFNETELQACLKTSKDNDASSKRDELRNNIIYRTFTRLQEEHKGLDLYKLVWEKLEKELQGVKNLYYSPSGLLHKVSFAAIPVNEADVTGDDITTSGKYARHTTLSDKYNMHLVTSTREIKRLKTERPETWSPKDSTAIYGGLQYYLHEDTMRLVAEAYRSSGTRGASWVYLEGTEKETKEIETLMKEMSVKTTLFTGIYGNEESFKHLSGTKTKVILLSTHGFFLSDVEHKRDLLQSLGGGNQRGGTNNPQGAVENPLLRSGLILSGGGTKWDEPGRVIESGLEDGILTAEEVSRLNLTNTKLVVLSACESGLGDAKNSEGVFGLQRAFKLAGIETIIMSLWQVSDNATNLLMTTFFTEWLSGKTKHDAFKIAQTKVREKFAAPYYWAAFVMLD